MGDGVPVYSVIYHEIIVLKICLKVENEFREKGYVGIMYKS